MAADDGRGLQLSRGNHLTHPAANTGGLDADDFPLFNVIRDRVVGTAQRCSRNGQILKAKLFNGSLHDHVDHIVAVPEVVVKGEGHAVFGAALF